MVHHALVHGNIRIAGHAEEALLLYTAACKDGGGIVGNQLLHEGKAGLLAVLDEKHALKLAADGHDAVANAVVFAAQLGHVVNIFVVQKREWMAGIHDLRAEQRQKFSLEISFPEMLLLLAELGKVHLAVALLCQSSDKMLEVFVALCLQLGHAGRDSSNLLRRRHVGDVIGLVVFHQRLVVQRADADHEELVHIAAEDGGKFQALTQGHGFFFGQRQHAAVEVQPAQFTVDKNALGLFQGDSPLFMVPFRRAFPSAPGPPIFLSFALICRGHWPHSAAPQRGRALPCRQ